MPGPVACNTSKPSSLAKASPAAFGDGTSFGPTESTGGPYPDGAPTAEPVMTGSRLGGVVLSN